MKIKTVSVEKHGILRILSEDGRTGIFDVRPYMDSEVFRVLRDETAFMQVSNGGYYIEWRCGADLSADTLEACWRLMEDAVRAVAEPRAPYGTTAGSSITDSPE
jgi:hypothetical protein